MSASSFWASRPRRDAQNERDGVGLRSSFAAANPWQQRLRRSSVGVALQPGTQHQLQLVPARHRVPPRGAATRGAAGSTSMRDSSTSRRNTAAPRGGTRAARSISSVAAGSAPSQQQQQQATAVSRDHERSTGRKTSSGSPSTDHRAAPRRICQRFWAADRCDRTTIINLLIILIYL